MHQTFNSFSLSVVLVLMVGSVVAGPSQWSKADELTYDVVVYGGTSAGIAAAVQVRRMGGTVVVIEPTKRLGGLTTGGLGQTDIGNKAAIGGIAREFYRRIRKHYHEPANWRWQQRDQYHSGGQTQNSSHEDTMWTFEPHVALSVMHDWVKEYQIPVIFEQRLDRTGEQKPGEQKPGEQKRGQSSRGVQMDGPRLAVVTMESGQSYRGRMFIDATYEGDLMAAAGVNYAVGRDSNEAYRETLNGVQTRQAKNHQLVARVDPYVVAGDAASGLLPGIDSDGPGIEGSGDGRVQAYCFRMCLTDHPGNRIPFAKPESYEPLQYELLLRNFEAGERGMPWINSAMPNRKTDTNNRTGFSTDYIGQNYAYPEASYTQREQIAAKHLSYQQGLMWTLANDPRVPQSIRQEVARWGTCRDEFERENGWQQQLYIREARRMIGETVMTQHHCQGREVAPRPISLAAYTMDSHNVQRYVTGNGHVLNEGNVEVGGFSPYPIEYGSIVPKQDQCENLLVPVCLSASHIAFGSIRMEPVFMVLGQSSATAAMQAIESRAAVQKVDYAKLRQRLLADDQVLAWTGPVRTSAASFDPHTLPGIVIDDEAGKKTGFVGTSNLMGPYVGTGYLHDGDTDKGQQSIRFEVPIEVAGRYEVRIAYSSHANRATNVPVTVNTAAGPTTIRVNQRTKPVHGAFGLVGQFEFSAGSTWVDISNADTDGHVIVDAVQLLPVAIQLIPAVR